MSMSDRFAEFRASLIPRLMPFADIVTPEMSMARLLRLSLFQVSVGMALVMLVGTLNRVMIVELGVPATIVGTMIALPLVFAPFRALIGYRSDTHRSELGWRRVPFIWKGTLLQFGGFAMMPFALLVLAGKGAAHDAPIWIGHSAAALAFLLVGAGAHTVQTAGTRALHRPHAAKVPCACCWSDVHHAAGRHDSQRAGVRSAARRILAGAACAGYPGRRGRHTHSEHGGHVEAGNARSATRPRAEAARPDFSARPGNGFALVPNARPAAGDCRPRHDGLRHGRHSSGTISVARC